MARQYKIIVWGIRSGGELLDVIFSNKDELKSYLYLEYIIGGGLIEYGSSFESFSEFYFDIFIEAEEMEVVKIEVNEFRNHGGDNAKEFEIEALIGED